MNYCAIPPSSPSTRDAGTDRCGLGPAFADRPTGPLLPAGWGEEAEDSPEEGHDSPDESVWHLVQESDPPKCQIQHMESNHFPMEESHSKYMEEIKIYHSITDISLIITSCSSHSIESSYKT